MALYIFSQIPITKIIKCWARKRVDFGWTGRLEILLMDVSIFMLVP